jgi:hypothetical protein
MVAQAIVVRRSLNLYVDPHRADVLVGCAVITGHIELLSAG